MKMGKKIWVVCPDCGDRKTRARFGELDFKCKCGTVFTAYIANSIQTTVIHDEDDNAREEDFSLAKYFEKYRAQRKLLAL